MPFYSWYFLVPPRAERAYEVWVEGEALETVEIRFPPGPCGLLKVAVFYGVKQIVPLEEGTFVAGDDEAVRAEPHWPLPESPCRLIIYARNEDEVYPHEFHLRLQTKAKEERVYARLTEEGFLEVVLPA